MDNAIFYTLAGDKRYYKNYTGTGNTINANHPVVRDHILAARRYWMVEMHVDGFRFDLASVLGRDGAFFTRITSPPARDWLRSD
jgi:glycogen operon protein